MHALPYPQDTVESGHDVVQNKQLSSKTTTTKSPHVVEILESSADKSEDGSYHFHFRAEDGSFREEKAVWMNQGTDEAYLEVTGAYSYFDADGKEVIVNYKADNHGFVPEGGNIPDVIAMAAKRNSELPPQVVEKKEKKSTE